MSNIVIDESRILQLEEDRVTLRNNLREQGIGCADDETLESLIAKVDDLQGWTKYLDKTMGGVIYNTTLTATTNSQFRNFTNLKGATFTALTNIVNDYGFADNPQLEFFYSLSVTNIGNGAFTNDVKADKIVVPSLTTSSLGNLVFNNTNVLRLLDLGLLPSVNGRIVYGDLQYLILRKSDSISTLTNSTFLNSKSPKTFVSNALISNYSSGTNWSATSCIYLSLEGSRFEDEEWFEEVYNRDGTPKATCTLDGGLIEVAPTETVAIFKHTENISHCYENGVELQDTDLVKGKTLTSTI